MIIGAGVLALGRVLITLARLLPFPRLIIAPGALSPKRRLTIAPLRFSLCFAALGRTLIARIAEALAFNAIGGERKPLASMAASA